MKIPAHSLNDPIAEVDKLAADLVRNLDTALVALREHGSAAPADTEASSPVTPAIQAIVDRIEHLRSAIPGAKGQAAVSLDALRRVLMQVEGDAKRLRTHRDRALANADEWERNAKLGVHAGDDPLAKEALLRRQEQLRLARHADVDLALLQPLLEALPPLLVHLGAR